MTVLGLLVGLLLLSFLMLIHELGHFLVGRALGFRVLEFSIFMGPRLFSFERKGVRYSLKAIPLGASVRFLGEEEEENLDLPSSKPASVPDTADVATRFQTEISADATASVLASDLAKVAEDDKGASLPAQVDNPLEGAFSSRPLWARALTVFAGPAVNLLAALLAFCLLFSCFGFQVPLQPQPLTNSPFALAGGQEGDLLLSIQGQPIRNALDYLYFERKHPQLEEATVLVEREGQVKELQLRRSVQWKRRLGIQLQTAEGEASEGLVIAVGQSDELAAQLQTAQTKELQDRLSTAFQQEVVLGLLQKGDRILAVLNPKAEGEALASNKLSRLTPSLLAEKLNANLQLGEEESSEAAKVTPFLIDRGGQQMYLLAPYQVVKALPSWGLQFSLEHNVLKSLPYSLHFSASVVRTTFGTLAGIFTAEEKASEVLSGPVGILTGITQVVQAQQVDWSLKLQQLLSLFALISMSLGIMNLLPIPLLDGGHLLLFAVEAVTGKKPSEKVRQIWGMLGLLCIALLFFLGLLFDGLRLLG